MFENNEEKKIPESITINGITYVVKDTPELQQLIQKVAKVEKSKLYSQFENLNRQIEQLKSVSVIEPQSSKTDFEGIVEKLKDTFITKEDLKATLTDTVKEVVKPVLDATEQSRVNTLEQYREQLIKANLATCIPELVKGNSKEELDAALQESIRLRSSYPSPSSATPQANMPVHDPLINKQAQEQAAENNPTPTPPAPAPAPAQVPTPPPTPRRQSPEVSGPTNISSMTQEEFAAQRDRLQQELRTLYDN